MIFANLDHHLARLRDPGTFGPLLGALLFGAVVGLFVLAWVYGGNHTWTTWGPRPVAAIEVCPSAVKVEKSLTHTTYTSRFDGYADAGDRATAKGYTVPVIATSACDGPWTAGVVQVRGCTDLVVVDGIDAVGCPLGHWDNVGMRADGSGIIYITDDAPDEAELHTLLHALGERDHTTAATSIMYRVPGTSWEGVSGAKGVE